MTETTAPVGRLLRRVYEVEILYREGETETDLNLPSLESLAQETDEGCASGLVTLKLEQELDEGAMSAALRAQGSEPDFLNIETVMCKFCDERVAAATAHLHRDAYVGDECGCWDERLRTTE